MVVKDLIGVAVAIVILAGIAVALQPGSETGAVVEKSGQAFSQVIKSATLKG